MSASDLPPSYSNTVVDNKNQAVGAASTLKNDDKERIKEMKEALGYYRPGGTIRVKSKRPRKPPNATRIGLFGGPGVGKSAFINSILYATADPHGIWRSEAPEAFTTERSMTMRKTAYDINAYLNICDNRGMVDFSTKIMSEVVNQIAGATPDRSEVVWDAGFFKRMVAGLNRAYSAREDWKLHCTVIVLSATSLTMRPSDMKELVETIVKMTGEPPIVVITHKKSTPSAHELAIFKGGLRDLNIEYVHEIENYTSKDHRYDAEKHIELLEIVNECTMVADRVMVHAEEQGYSCTIL